MSYLIDRLLGNWEIDKLFNEGGEPTDEQLETGIGSSVSNIQFSADEERNRLCNTQDKND